VLVLRAARPTRPEHDTLRALRVTVHSGRSGVVAVSMATVRLISSLLREIPPANGTAQVQAAWFDRKAEVFERISTEDQALAEEAAQFAEAARAQAEGLRRGWL